MVPGQVRVLLGPAEMETLEEAVVVPRTPVAPPDTVAQAAQAEPMAVVAAAVIHTPPIIPIKAVSVAQVEPMAAAVAVVLGIKRNAKVAQVEPMAVQAE